VWLDGVHIAPYKFAVGFGTHDPDRARKLLRRRDKIEKLQARVDQERVSIVPLRFYLRDGKVKVELGIGKGLKQADKGQVIAERDQLREAEREMRRYQKGGQTCPPIQPRSRSARSSRPTGKRSSNCGASPTW
jgi:SsrA-binding protein